MHISHTIVILVRLEIDRTITPLALYIIARTPIMMQRLDANIAIVGIYSNDFVALNLISAINQI